MFLGAQGFRASGTMTYWTMADFYRAYGDWLVRLGCEKQRGTQHVLLRRVVFTRASRQTLAATALNVAGMHDMDKVFAVSYAEVEPRLFSEIMRLIDAVLL